MATIKSNMLFMLNFKIHEADPDFINIGADSKGHNLPEPAADEIHELINALRREGYQVNLKKNLKRITGDKYG
jgi:hypothetical protein